MKIFDLFSKRKKRELGEAPDVYTYDKIPESLRVQIIHIWTDVVGRQYSFANENNYLYAKVNEILCREYGVFSLINSNTRKTSAQEELNYFFLASQDNQKVLDIIELVFKMISQGNFTLLWSDITPQAAIAELNIRFREHGIGYQFESEQLIRKDSEVIHKEIVKPVLNLLNSPIYRGANEEFLKAFEHYKQKRYKECLNECLKSFESVMKIICDKRKWAYDQNDAAKKLIEICLTNGLIPNYLQNQFTSLKSILESGVPTARNKTSGHGQGVNTTVVPDYFANYVMNLTGTTILFLVEAEKNLP